MKNYKCKDCGETFDSPQLMGAHRRLNHPRHTYPPKRIGRPPGSKTRKKTHAAAPVQGNGVMDAISFCPYCGKGLRAHNAASTIGV